MFVDLEPEADLLEGRVGLVLPCFTRLLSGLVLELAVVHEFGDRRLRLRRDLDEIEVRFTGEIKGLSHCDDAHLLPIRSDEADFRDSDPVVDTRLADVLLLLD
ncbi:hypothetical protein GCM10023159_18640 [Brevibacterium yomogidense]